MHNVDIDWKGSKWKDMMKRWLNCCQQSRMNTMIWSISYHVNTIFIFIVFLSIFFLALCVCFRSRWCPSSWDSTRVHIENIGQTFCLNISQRFLKFFLINISCSVLMESVLESSANLRLWKSRSSNQFFLRMICLPSRNCLDTAGSVKNIFSKRSNILSICNTRMMFTLCQLLHRCNRHHCRLLLPIKQLYIWSLPQLPLKKNFTSRWF